MSDLLPQILRLIATALNQAAELFEARLANQQQHSQNADLESGLQHNHDTASSVVPHTPTQTSQTLDLGTCLYCTRSRIRNDIPRCFYHLDRETKRELYSEL